ncbi:hypothetical protein M8C21_025625 [Ambrosia artemisiifolia]|uniref:Uncharacterized protein n=1 Tax=Ambrosia artemisiifolia TaxID=4212 RepID=A0AAD5D5Q4_AMBAR|nr:hypothetical protein M8C21_025625 [Ambrosia artemisiifolia]
MLPVITTTHSLSDSMATQQKPKILIVAYPTQGHINPSLRFANRLVNLGVDVTFSTSVSVTRHIDIQTTRHGLTFAPFSDGHHNGLQPTTTLQQFFLDFSTNGASAIADIISSAMAEGQPFDHLVYTTIVPWAAKVAHAHKLKSTLLWCQPAIVLDIYYYNFNGYQDLISCNNNNPTFPINLPGLPSLTIDDLPSFMKASSPKEEDYVLPFMKEHIDALKISPRILVNTFDALEVEPIRAIDKLVMLPVGPLVPSNNSFVCDLFEKPKEDYIEWLNTKPKSSVVYVSFGSMATLSIDQAQAEEMAYGLVESGRPFLWVIRDGGQARKLSKIEVLKKQGMIVSWCSQVEVLNHQAVGSFLMHGGWNSTVEALAAGVPVVAFPLWADQWTNAKMIEDVWKAGVKVKRREGDGMVEGKEIKRCVEMVMEDVEIRRNAKKWKELASEALDDGGSSAINLQSFVDNATLTHPSVLLTVSLTWVVSVIRRIDMQTTHHGLTFAPFSDGHDDGLQPTTTFHQFHSDFSTNGASAVADIISSAAAAGQPFDHLVYTSGVPWVAKVANAHNLESSIKVKRREGDGMVEGKEIKRCVEMVMEDGEMRRNAEKWRELARQALSEGGSSAVNLQSFVENNNSPMFPINLPGLPSLTIADLPSFMKASSPKEEDYVLPFMKEHIDALKISPRILVNTFDALKVEPVRAIDKLVMLPVGPLVPSNNSFVCDLFEEPKEDCIEWLNTKPKSLVVYASFGSMTTLSIDQAQAEEMAYGLVESGRPFLWVIRDGEQERKLSKIEALKKQGMIVSWCSQMEVLNHQAVGCFLTHGGWNSMVEALAAGVPIEDQWTNAKMIEDVWKAGVKVKRREGDGMVEGMEIKRCVEMVMEDGEMRRNAEKWKDLARQALCNGGSSAVNLQAFVDNV